MNLEKQKSKLKEVDISVYIKQIESNFEELKNQPDNKYIEMLIRRDISNIMQINIDAIISKSNHAGQTAKKAIHRLTLFGISCFIVALILLLNLPRSIAKPITKLIEGTKEISKKNYEHRIYIRKGQEFKNLAESFNYMTEKLQEYAHISLSKLWFEKKRIEIIINSLYDPIIILDEYNNILFINNQALNIADLKIENVLGLPIEKIVQTNIFMQSLFKDISIKDLKEGKKQEIKLKINNEEKYFDVKYLDIMIGSMTTEKKAGTIILLQNITSYKQQDIAKTNFIASMSHNFKTPISSSQIGIELLKKNKTGQLNEEQKKLIDSIEEDIQKILVITKNLLKISEVESGNIQLNITSIDLRGIISYAVNTIRRQADRKFINLDIDIPSEIPMIKGDAEKIAWVLINLISNAIRYSNEYSKVKVRLEDTEKHIYLFVEDQGQGIPSEYKERIFARYFRAPDTNRKGTGLGLTISKEFIEAQGGTIKVESDLGKGSKFIVILKK